MSCAKIDPALHQARKPPWIKVRLPSNPVFFSTKALISDLRLHTVCESAQCPNRWECWSQGTATFMIAGDRCTRACGFCAVTTARPYALEADEPQRVAEATRWGSSASSAYGLAVDTAQKPQARVQRSPAIMKVAVPLLQHSQWFGHLALSQTV